MSAADSHSHPRTSSSESLHPHPHASSSEAAAPGGVPPPPTPPRPQGDVEPDHEARRQQYELELRQRRLEQQAIRRTEITREHQQMAAIKEREDAYWAKQDQRYEAMINRLQVAEQTSKELYRYLGKASRVMTQASEAIKMIGQFGLTETGTLRQAAIAQDILAKTTSQYLTEMNERVISDSIRQSGQLAKNSSKKYESLLAQGEKIQKEMKSHRLRVHEAWMAYELAVAERQKMELSQKPLKDKDPFLAVRAYDRELSDHATKEASYRAGMTALFTECRMEDGRRIDAIKSVMLDNLLAQKAVLEHTVKFTDQAIAAVKAIDREQDVLEFVLQADLVIPPHGTAAATLSSVPSAGVHAGTPTAAAAAAAAAAAPTTAPAMPRTSSLPTAAHPPTTPRTSSAPQPISVDSMTTVFEVPPPTRDPRSLYRLYSYEVAHEGTLHRPGKIMKSHWKPIHVAVTTSGFLHYFDERLNHVPSLSIPLHDCSVALSPGTSPFAFEVIQPTSGFFGLGSANTVFVFKASSDMDLHEWMTAITKYAKIVAPTQLAPAQVQAVPVPIPVPVPVPVPAHVPAQVPAPAAAASQVHAPAQVQALTSQAPAPAQNPAPLPAQAQVPAQNPAPPLPADPPTPSGWSTHLSDAVPASSQATHVHAPDSSDAIQTGGDSSTLPTFLRS